MNTFSTPDLLNILTAFKLVVKIVHESNLKGIGIFMINIIVITLKKSGKRERGRCIHVFLVYRWNITVIIGLLPNGAASSHVIWCCWRRSCWAAWAEWLKFVVDGASKYRYCWCFACIGMWLGAIRQKYFIQGPSPVTQLCDRDFENVVTAINFCTWTFSRG